MKATHRHGNAGCPEWACDVEGARILILLNADERNTSEIVVTLESGQQRRDVDARVGFVDDFDVNGYVHTKHAPLGAIGCDAVDGGKRIRRSHGAPPPDHVSVVVVVRWFDQHELKMALRCHIGLSH
jgi:hypothetical protein